MSNIIFKDGYIYLEDDDGKTVNRTRECVEATRDYLLSVAEDIDRPFAGISWDKVYAEGSITLAVFDTDKYDIKEVKE